MENYYTGLKGIYFRRILKKIVRLGDLRNKAVLDFGCGTGELRKMLGGGSVTGYDIMLELSEIKDWKKIKFDTVVANQVFYSMSQEEIKKFITELHQYNPIVTLIVGIGRKGLLNKLGAALLQKNAHDKYVTEPKDELLILQSKLKIIKQTSVFRMCDIYLMEFL